MDRRFYVYILYRRDGVTPFYVGKGHGRRWGDHRWGYRNPHKTNIIKAMQRDGIDIPKEKVAWDLTEDDAFSFERYLIEFYGRISTTKGPLTNLTDGGEGPNGMILSPQHIAAIASANRGNTHTLGRKLSPEHIAAISRANKGKTYTRSPETIAKMSAAQLGKVYSDEINKKKGRLGRKASEQELIHRMIAQAGHPVSMQTRAKISNSLRGHTYNLGSKRPLESRAKMRTAKLGKTASEQTRKKMSESAKRAWAARTH